MPTKKAARIDWHKRYRELLDERVNIVQEKLAEIAALRKELLADEAEVHFWITEYERWRDRVVEYERLHATLPDGARRQLVLAKFKVEEQP